MKTWLLLQGLPSAQAGCGCFEEKLLGTSWHLAVLHPVCQGAKLRSWCVQAGVLPESFPDLEIRSKELFGLTSFALSLLLVSGRSCWLLGRQSATIACVLPAPAQAL
jgi:hypothetical protein